MILFVLSLVALILGYFIYGTYVDQTFGSDATIATPARRIADGVDYVEMGWSKAFLIQFLNIAGTGPIFGAIAGAMWGPAAFLWIVFGCIFGGAVHDFVIGMMSTRHDGASVSELVGSYLGNGAKQIMRVFSVILLLLVGVVFITSPAGILVNLTKDSAFFGFLGNNANSIKLFFIAIIIIYYIIATVLPVDQVIGKIYPFFGAILLIMALGIAFHILKGTYAIPNLDFSNLNMHPGKKSIFPFLFISIACGAISGFHATQSPMMARCLKSEADGKKVFFGAMITEGVVALIWAAIAMSFYGGTTGLAAVLTAPGANPGIVVTQVSVSLLGKIGGALAILGVVVCPITSGDTAFRSARLTIADSFKLNQGPIMNRFLVALPLFAIGIPLCFMDFNILWRYFAWSNQTLATIALWTGAMYLHVKGKNFWLAAIPATFMTMVVSTYILIAPEGLSLAPSVAYPIAAVTTVVVAAAFLISLKKKSN